jgi:asparagine synthase (glutamine-hydrolysing)
VDRATMNVGLEARIPLLDRRIVEWSWQLPIELKRRNGIGKAILRDLLGRDLPGSAIDRPKMGFGVPVGHWLRGRLRPWAEDLLDTDGLWSEGYLVPTVIRETWKQHLDGRQDASATLWDVLMFQSWLRSQ